MPFDKDIHVTNQFTGSECKPVRDADKGWILRVGDSLGVAHRTTRDFAKRNYKVALGAAAGLSMMAAAERADAGMMVPLDYRADTDAKVVGLKAYDDLTPEVKNSGLFETPYGSVVFESNGDDAPAGWRLWFLDTGHQPVGTIVTGFGSYNISPRNALVFGDDPDTVGIDEGATMQTAIVVIAQDISNRVWEAHFSAPVIFNDNETAIYRDIHVTSNEITPEPATLALFGAGAGMAALTRRKCK